jgi:regulatory protein
MGKITRLAYQKRNKERISVFLDGEYGFSLTLSSAEGLFIGQTLEKDEITKLVNQDALEKAKQHAYHYLSYRPRSIAEIRHYLQKKEYSDATVDKAIDQLIKLDYLNDSVFAQYWVEQREVFRPRSRLFLRNELYQKGVDREIVDDALANLDESDAAYRAGSKKAQQWSNLPQETFLLKMKQYLKRRGFNYAVSNPVSLRLWSEMESAREDN